jgi:hypothetical protein
MMNENEERALIKKAYPSKTWATKVDEMRGGQVHAIYIRLKNQRKI